jgi:hypothetical protein
MMAKVPRVSAGLGEVSFGCCLGEPSSAGMERIPRAKTQMIVSIINKKNHSTEVFRASAAPRPPLRAGISSESRGLFEVRPKDPVRILYLTATYRDLEPTEDGRVRGLRTPARPAFD